MKTITIDGVEYELIPKQNTEERKRDFHDFFDISEGTKYFFISNTGCILETCSYDHISDRNLAAVANACRHFAIMEERALYETLNRLIWRESVKTGGFEIPWDGAHDHYFIEYDTQKHKFFVMLATEYNTMTPSFPTEELAQNTIDEVVIPFMKEHPKCYF